LKKASNTINPLHNDSGSGSATITDGRHAVLADLELMQQGGEDPGSGASQGVAQGDGTAEQIYSGVFETEDLAR
jgi:hypothetical protein